MSHINSQKFDRELKKGGAELLVLSLLEARPRHGYEVRKLIETRSDGVLKFNAASLYPLLYRLEKRGWIEGKWVEKAGQRRRRYYKLTKDGKKVLSAQRSIWQSFVAAINRVTGLEGA
ncbi:MAG TPA: PadR family transcriptional regulator [Blastocatellia bacterium]|nr:PadR family transcriptional regulator [Blastocatellia bacterium]HMX26521.1 PadR family transcriptional regulator [Blastocatellia bacterium]HMZ20952.1 PadR family transcriptional regulator [Blastocatellia bacterium]HNG32047.1 PadR family transcriptional regulator [Blastocatellia bacterium]